MIDSPVLHDSRAAFAAAVAGARHAQAITTALDDVIAWSAAQGADLVALPAGDQATVGVGFADGDGVLWRAYPRQADGAKIVVLPGSFEALPVEERAALRAAFDEAVPGGEFATAGYLQGPLVLLADEIVQRQFRVALAAALAAMKARSRVPAA